MARDFIEYLLGGEGLETEDAAARNVLPDRLRHGDHRCL